jgi:pimeloyl-ACP methyl ester carboxylesterase
MKKFLRIVLIALPILLVIAVVGFLVWASNPLQPTSEALAALESDAQVTVSESNGWTVFTPAGAQPTTGFIFYPGGRVDYRAYAPPLRDIAAQGYTVVLVPMPLSLAVFDLSAADRVRAAFPQMTHWAIGGHSLGGAIAARYVQSQPGAMQGIVFWGSFPDIDLSMMEIAVASIYGTADGLSAASVVEGSRTSLPTDAQFTRIEGGNHSQFGWYGEQPGDNLATISHADQQAQAFAATVAVLQAISG